MDENLRLYRIQPYGEDDPRRGTLSVIRVADLDERGRYQFTSALAWRQTPADAQRPPRILFDALLRFMYDADLDRVAMHAILLATAPRELHGDTPHIALPFAPWGAWRQEHGAIVRRLTFAGTVAHLRRHDVALTPV